MSPVPRQCPGVVRTAILVLAAVSAAACTAGREAKSDSAKQAESASARKLAAAPSAKAPAAALPGTLTKPIDQYTGDELHDFVQSLRWMGGHERQRRCEGDPSCNGTSPGKTTLVRIDAVDGEDSLAIAGLPSNGVVAAQLTNRGALEEREYKLKAGGRYAYYLIVYPGDSTGAWRLEELDHQGSTYSHREIGRGKFSSCDHPFVRGARADFKSCANAAGSGQMKLMLQGSDPTMTDPIWVSCSGGCCIASAS